MSGIFRVEGLDEAIKRTQALTNALEPKQIEKVLLKGANIVAGEVRRRARGQFKVKTGNLSKSPRSKRGARHRDIAMAFAAIDRKVAPHADLLEYGTSKMPAKPFFRPAVDATEAQASAEVEAGIDELLKGAGAE